MPLLTVVNLHHAYGTQVVLDGATVSIEAGEKVGLVGRNGCGKTTLMRIMQGRLKPDSGSVQLARGSRVGYLSQDPAFDPQDTVRDAAEGAFAELHRLHVELHHLFDRMAAAGAEELPGLLKKQAQLEARIDAAGGYAIDHRIDATLHGLGFTDAQFGLGVASLSGGQKGRLGLARLLLEAPDLLLLDEPTNHLDIDGRQWLESFLADEYAGAVLVVSHDRWLLDRVVDRIIEVERGSIWDYPGNYHTYLQLKAERQLTYERVYEKQMDRVRQEEAFIDRYRAGQRARQAQGRLARLERFKRDELVERPLELGVMKLRLPPAPRSGDQVVVAQGLSKAYGDKILFRDLDLTIMRGERIGIIGPNGSGKTTLVRCLLGELEPDSGSARLGSRLGIGYYRQLHEHLDLSLSVWQYLQSVIVSLDGAARASEQQARDLAGAFLFSGAEQDKRLGDLSGGERSRAVLAGLMASAKNLLVLDEPTNHLDIPSSRRLEEAVAADGGYEGTLILISHDRALLDATCTRLIVLDGRGGSTVFSGRYSEWDARRRAEPTPAPRPDRPPRTGAAPDQPPPRRRAPRPEDGAPSAKLAGRTGGESSPSRTPPRPAAALARLSIERLESRIEELQGRIAQIDRSMIDPAVYADGRQCKSLQDERCRLAEELLPLEFEWSRRADETSA
jgi:ATP-binding cassette subfamily F protein 3